MNDKELYDKITALHKPLNEISDAVAMGIEYIGTDLTYVAGKFESIFHSAKHIKGQFDYKIKERNTAYKQKERDKKKLNKP